MSSSYEYLSTGRFYDLSHLDKLRQKWELDNPGIYNWSQINVIYMNLKFLDMFLSLQSFTTVCCDVTQKVQAVFPYAESEIKRIDYLFEVKSMFDELEEQIWEIKLEIRDEYSFPEASQPLPSNVAIPEFVKRFIDNVVMNLSDLLVIRHPFNWSWLVPGSSRQQMEEVVKELKLLRNFVYFISDRCTDPQSQHTFFTHVLVVAGHAAMISWVNLPNLKSKDIKVASAKMNASFSDLQMKIQPIQPCVRKIYIDVLQALESGWHPNIQAEDAAAYKAGFVETLVHFLEELPITFKDHMAMLNYLKANLINLPREALKDLDAAIIDAGLLVYSSFSGDIQSMKALIYFLTRKSFQTNLPKIDGLGSIDIILDDLKELLNCYSDSLSSMRSQLWTIQQQLEHFQKKHDVVGSFAMQVISKAYEVNHLVVGCINNDIPEWCLVLWIGDIIEEITLIVREVAEIHENKVSDLVLHNTTDVATPHTLQFERITSMSEEMVGFDEVVNKLRRQLIGGLSGLDVISIVGMPGLGKTTLANKLFFDQLVVSHFDVRAQCCVSQVYTRKDLLLTILRGVEKDAVISDNLPENELADKLRKLLLVQRYLILVDDVWEKIAWDDLKPCFCDANNRSRIIVTTRLGDVAYHAQLVSDPHFLRLFTPEESWMLLKNKVFNTRSCPLVLEDVGRKIAQKCGGLPLSVVLVAGILETTEKEKHSWEQVAINLGSHIQVKSEDIINLSYQDLPFHLKPCFLYFGVFLEDEEIQVSKLTWLWIAEGLVKTHKEKLSEDLAEYYLKNLIGKNLVMVSKISSDGKIKACRIHDLLLDFCKQKAKVENFLQCIKGDNGNMNPSYQKHSIPRRLCLHFQGDNLSKWSSICSDVQSFHLMRGKRIGLFSIAHASHTFNSFKFLWVLNLEFTVIDSFPEALTCLRYVAVRVAEDSSLSFSANLVNLETLIVKGLGGRVTLPPTLWKMVKLRHLHIYNHVVFNINNSLQKLDDLRTLSSAWFPCTENMNKVFENIPNLQKLRCEVPKFDGYDPAFNNLTKLEILKFSWGRGAVWANKLNFPPSLKKLTLSNCRIFSLEEIATIPRLVVLKLLHITIRSKVWKVTDEQFLHLKFLKLQDPSFSEWNISDDAFPCLEHLVLRRLQHLQEIPYRFADMPTLKSIEVMACKQSLVESAEDIQKTQVEVMQNSNFKLFIQK
ncbi:putative late blight resistance protein homolog R1B-16 [Capsicum annuum]|uniref:putative late blight resistance protein homolog R1B-16 n=1 Tax=Capsicum annuum TaxID=4072 RepID=UPI001FB0BCC3|nr:putative late blight resistance protein homolog R1B-16 [Capsicum annuum]